MQFRRILLTAAVLASGLTMVSFVPVQAAPAALPAGESPPIEVSVTVPAYVNALPFGTASGQWQINQLNLLLLTEKGANHQADPFQSTFAKYGDDFQYCGSEAACAEIIKLTVTRGAATIDFPVETFFVAGDYQGAFLLKNASTVGIPGLLENDILNIKFSAGVFDIPVGRVITELFIRYDSVQKGSEATSPNSDTRAENNPAFELAIPIPSAPVATAGMARATVSINPLIPDPPKYLITSTPGKKTCTITPPATSCVVTQLTPGVQYTFKAQSFNSDGLRSSTSAASNSITPFSAPEIYVVSPNLGTVHGGTKINLEGDGFEQGATVTVGGAPCTNLSVDSSTSITCETPAGLEGYVDVVITNPDSGTHTMVSGFYYLVLDPEYSPVPYQGPTNLLSPSRSSCGQKELVVTGKRLETISEVSVGGISTSFRLLSNEKLAYSLPKLASGRYQVKFWVPVNNVYLTSEITVANCSASAQGGNLALFRKSFSNFRADKSSLTSAEIAQIKAFVAKKGNISQVRCVGSTSGVPAKRTDRALARARAKNACDIVKTLVPNATYTLETSIGKGVGQRFRSVTIFISGTN